jgi:hypothetical protein
MKKFICKTIIVLVLFLQAGTVLGWHDKTHLAVAKAAKYKMWYNAAGPDIAKIKAGNIEAYNHWYGNNSESEITSQTVIDQISRYNKDTIFDMEGHLYGAIAAALRAYEQDTNSGKYGEYHLVYCAHYIGDLAMPLHNIPYDDYNKNHHSANDGIVEQDVLMQPEKIEQYMYKIALSDDRFEADLTREIARIANLSRLLGYKLRAGKRNMTQQEAYIQLGHSASLLKAALQHYKKF